LIQKIAPQLKAMPYRLPLFPDDTYMSPNRRVTITLMREETPLPDNLTP